MWKTDEREKRNVWNAAADEQEMMTRTWIAAEEGQSVSEEWICRILNTQWMNFLFDAALEQNFWNFAGQMSLAFLARVAWSCQCWFLVIGTPDPEHWGGK